MAVKHFAYKECKFCKTSYREFHISRHVNACGYNPVNMRVCGFCKEKYPAPRYKTTTTCSRRCANKLYRSGINNGNWKGTDYRIACFAYHSKKCIYCGEDKVVEAHHVNGNHHDNRPENLVPLCPTHHRYAHVDDLKGQVDKRVAAYLKRWKSKKSIDLF